MSRSRPSSPRFGRNRGCNYGGGLQQSAVYFTDSVSNVGFDSWVFSATGETTSVGSSPFDIALQASASCVTGSCLTNPLQIYYTSQSFSLPSNAFTLSVTSTLTSGESIKTLAWADSTNTDFGGALPTRTSGDGIELLLSDRNNETLQAEGGPAEGPTPYSLTIEESFSDDTGTAATFTANGQITPTSPPSFSAPEIDPASAMGGLTLLAGGLAVFRGRRSKK